MIPEDSATALSVTADSSLVSTTSEPLTTTTTTPLLLPPSSISSILTEARSELEDEDEEEEEEALPSLAGDVSGGIVSSLSLSLSTLHDLDPQLYKVCSFVLGVYRICVSVFVNPGKYKLYDSFLASLVILQKIETLIEKKFVRTEWVDGRVCVMVRSGSDKDSRITVGTMNDSVK